MKGLEVIPLLLFPAALVMSSVNGALASPPFRGLSAFSPCLASAQHFTLTFAPDQPSAFKVGDKMTLRLILTNEGPDTHVVLSSMITTLEIRVITKEGKHLARDPFESSMWGRRAGGPSYFPAGLKREIAAPLNQLVPQMDAPGVYNVSAALHVYFPDSNEKSCVTSPTRAVTVLSS